MGAWAFSLGQKLLNIKVNALNSFEAVTVEKTKLKCGRDKKEVSRCRAMSTPPIPIYMLLYKLYYNTDFM